MCLIAINKVRQLKKILTLILLIRTAEFVGVDLTLNTEYDIKYSQGVVLLCVKKVAPDRTCIWQIKFAPCLTSSRTQLCLSDNICDHIPPYIGQPNSNKMQHFDIICGPHFADRSKKILVR